MKHLVTRIFLTFFAALLLAGLGTVALTTWLIGERQQAADAELLEAARSAANALAAGGRPALISWAEARVSDPEKKSEVFILDESGEELLGRSVAVKSPTPSATIDEDIIDDFSAVFLELPRESPLLVSDEGETFRLRAVPRRVGLAAWRDIPLWLLGLAFTVTALASLLLARSITRPIRGLQQTTEHLARGEFGARVDPAALRRHDEIGRLARSLDAMAGQLSALIRGQRQLLRDLSHEIRSPLARIRLATGLLSQRDAAAHSTVTRIDEEVSRLDGLIEQILEVSRLESGSNEWKRESLDLRVITERIIADAEFEATQLGKSLSKHVTDEALPLIGDGHWVHSAIENVLRNALRHTAAGTGVSVTLQRRDSIGLLEVSDCGSGLEESELPKIFEPFYRGRDPQGKSADGAGLGLAIVARVMRAHDGTLAARNRRDASGRICGLEISLGWPLAATQAPDDRTVISP